MMDNVATTMRGLDLGMEHLVKCTVFMADLSQWQAFNQIYIQYFEPGRYPARAAFGATEVPWAPRSRSNVSRAHHVTARRQAARMESDTLLSLATLC